MSRIGVYCGTFDPPHIGHMGGAAQAISSLQLDKLLLVPGGIMPHKTLPSTSPTPQQRLEMVRIASLGVPGAEVCDVEVNSGEVCYTCDTLRQLKQQYPADELVLILGSDRFAVLHKWKEIQQILSLTSVGVLRRGEKGEGAAILRQMEVLEKMGARIYLCDNDVVDISSTNLRRMLAFDCAQPFLPAGVGSYIRENCLYGTDRDLRGLDMDRLEQTMIPLMNPNRVAHVLGCRDTAVELARRWGADETDAARAGLLHDITKALDGPLQLTLCREYGMLLDTFSQKNPKTLHALTGSLVAQRIFGENEAVVSAIRHHTTGCADMNTLQKIIYVADYMEPNRDFIGVEELRQLAFEDLDKALLLGLTMTLNMLKAQNREISPESSGAVAWLNSRGVTL